MKRLVGLFILVPIGIIVVALSVANRQAVTLSIPPQIGDTPLYSFDLPLYALLFATLLVGMLIGSSATWISQGRHRKSAREQKLEATKLSFEAIKLKEKARANGENETSESKALQALGLTSSAHNA